MNQISSDLLIIVAFLQYHRIIKFPKEGKRYMNKENGNNDEEKTTNFDEEEVREKEEEVKKKFLEKTKVWSI